MNQYKSCFFIFSFIIVFSSYSFAQFNFGVGYSIGFLNPETDRNITNTFNTDRPWLEDSLEPIKNIQGLHLGLRYRLEFVALDFTWRNRFRTKRAEGIDPSTDANFRRNVTHIHQSYSLGIETFIGDFNFGNFSYGGSIDFERFLIRTEVTGIDGDFSILKKTGLGSHFFVAFNLDAGPTLDFSIRPYIQIPWQQYNIAAYDAELNGNTSTAAIDENYMNIGIMFIFFNGSKW